MRAKPSGDAEDRRRVRDDVAAALSLLPGLGHIYKGHWRAGSIIMLCGVPMAIWVGALVGLATLGAGALLVVAFWVVVGAHAFYVEPRHGRAGGVVGGRGTA